MDGEPVEGVFVCHVCFLLSLPVVVLQSLQVGEKLFGKKKKKAMSR